VKDSRVIKINIGAPTPAQTQARREAARLWDRLVKVHKYCRNRHWSWPNKDQLQKHFKGRFALHSQTVQGIIDKFCANIDSTRTRRKQGDKLARYPWRERKTFQTVVWKGQSVKCHGNRLTLPMGRGRKPLCVKIPANLPPGKLAMVELGFRELRLVLVNDVDAAPAAGMNVVAADPGVIHQAVLTDGIESMAVVGRGLRSLTQGKNKRVAELTRLIDKCQKGSRRRRKLKRRKARVLERYARQTHNLLHHSANQIIDFCVAREAGTLVVGDVADISRNKHKTRKGSRRSNQENSGNPLGQLYNYLEYKGALRGVRLVKLDEAYTSQTCPHCSHRRKPVGRIYRCTNPECGFVGVRDEVGAANILNKYLHGGKMIPGIILPTGKVKYHRPVRLHAARPGVGRLTGGTLLGTTPCPVPVLSSAGAHAPSELDVVA